MFELFCRQYTLGHISLTILYITFPSPWALELKVKIAYVCQTMLLVQVHETRKKHGNFCVISFCRRRAHVKTMQTNNLKNVKISCRCVYMWYECALNVWNAVVMHSEWWNKFFLMKVVKFFPSLNYSRDSPRFFSGFEISFVTWFHLVCSKCMPPALEICACICMLMGVWMRI